MRRILIPPPLSRMVTLGVISLLVPALFTVGTLPLLASSPVSWGELFNWLRRSKTPLGSRGDICPLTPGRLGQVVTVWHERPLFLWRGAVAAIAVRPSGQTTILWSQAAPPPDAHGFRHLPYTGPPLQPGQTYDWLFFSAATSQSPLLWVPFQLIPADEHAPITAQLQALEAGLGNAAKASVAQARLNFFAEHALWADALQELFATDDPAGALTRYRATVYQQGCPAGPPRPAKRSAWGKTGDTFSS